MNRIPERDITGRCQGECRDRVREGEDERQAQINGDALEAPEDFPHVQWADQRNAPPGALGGHV